MSHEPVLEPVSEPVSALVTLRGREQPGLLPRLLSLLAQQPMEVLAQQQAEVNGWLLLGLRVRLPAGSTVAATLREGGRALGVEVEVRALSGLEAQAPAWVPYAVTAVGGSLGCGVLGEVAACLEEHGARVERLQRLAPGVPEALELRVALPPEREPGALKQALLERALAGGFDVSLQREGLYRRHRRMLVMDMDSTAIRIEVIDELARAHGVGEQVARITERAMQGELDYDESLRQRVALLEGLEVGVLHRIAANLPLSEGVERLVRVVKHLGWRTAVLSGGFSVAAEALRQRLGLDHAWSNVLEEREGRLTGRTVGTIVNAQRKAERLESLARAERMALEQVVAVGDGANDLLMLERAGLGVAFHAKPRLRQAADVAICAGGLDCLLYMLGLSEQELQQAEAASA